MNWKLVKEAVLEGVLVAITFTVPGLFFDHTKMELFDRAYWVFAATTMTYYQLKRDVEKSK